MSVKIFYRYKFSRVVYYCQKFLCINLLHLLRLFAVFYAFITFYLTQLHTTPEHTIVFWKNLVTIGPLRFPIVLYLVKVSDVYTVYVCVCRPQAELINVITSRGLCEQIACTARFVCRPPATVCCRHSRSDRTKTVYLVNMYVLGRICYKLIVIINFLRKSPKSTMIYLSVIFLSMALSMNIINKVQMAL